MLREPNHSQPVPSRSRGPKLVLAVIWKDDGSHGRPGDVNVTRILEVRVSPRDLARTLRAVDRLSRLRASVGRLSPPAQDGTGQSRVVREFPKFEQGAGV
jgi:hypothetical protein